MKLPENAITPLIGSDTNSNPADRNGINIPSLDKGQEKELEELELDWSTAFGLGALKSEHLQKIALPERRPLIGDWFREADLGFIFAQRGVGKTWFSMMIAKALSGSVTHVGPWDIHNRVPVLYLDGEMPIDDIKNRDSGMVNVDGSVTYLHHEILFRKTGRVMNLTDTDFQLALLEFCRTGGFKVLFLDNLSTLALGINENDADDWEKLQPWLLRLRREGIAVVFVHHAGRKKEHMRGTTKREDAAFWVVGLDDASSEGSKGAKFMMRFTKNRNSTGDDTKPITWHFQPQESGDIIPEYSKVSREDDFLELLRGGLNTCRDLAEEMECSKGTISKLAKRMMESGKITIEGRIYRLN